MTNFNFQKYTEEYTQLQSELSKIKTINQINQMERQMYPPDSPNTPLAWKCFPPRSASEDYKNDSECKQMYNNFISICEEISNDPTKEKCDLALLYSKTMKEYCVDKDGTTIKH